jgi:hypothetical protein
MQPRERETYRQDLSSIKLCGLTLTETWHAPNFKIPYHAHKRASICLSLNGRALGTRPARALILLHELGHLIRGEDGKWLLPDDGNDDRQSRANTQRVQAVCRAQLATLK